jgi:hypothetical protein
MTEFQNKIRDVMDGKVDWVYLTPETLEGLMVPEVKELRALEASHGRRSVGLDTYRQKKSNLLDKIYKKRKEIAIEYWNNWEKRITKTYKEESDTSGSVRPRDKGGHQPTRCRNVTKDLIYPSIGEASKSTGYCHNTFKIRCLDKGEADRFGDKWEVSI